MFRTSTVVATVAGALALTATAALPAQASSHITYNNKDGCTVGAAKPYKSDTFQVTGVGYEKCNSTRLVKFFQVDVYRNVNNAPDEVLGVKRYENYYSNAGTWYSGAARGWLVNCRVYHTKTALRLNAWLVPVNIDSANTYVGC